MSIMGNFILAFAPVLYEMLKDIILWHKYSELIHSFISFWIDRQDGMQNYHPEFVDLCMSVVKSQVLQCVK